MSRWKTCEIHNLKYKGLKCCCCVFEIKDQEQLKEIKRLKEDIINLNGQLLTERNKGFRLQEKYKAKLYQIPF